MTEIRRRTSYFRLVARFKRRLLRATLRRTRGNVKAAAKMLAVHRGDIYELFKKHGIDPNEFRVRPILRPVLGQCKSPFRKQF